jgi:mitogen-activated protein kinase 15
MNKYKKKYKNEIFLKIEYDLQDPNQYLKNYTKKKFFKELNFIKQFNHKNIIKLKDIKNIPNSYKDLKTVSLDFENIEYDLKEFIQTNRLNSATIKNILFQILKSIHYLHSFNISHRDLSSTSFFLTKNLEIKLTNFYSAGII